MGNGLFVKYLLRSLCLRYRGIGKTLAYTCWPDSARYSHNIKTRTLTDV